MRRSDFHYELPAELIAQHPLPERSGSRLLALDGSDATPCDRLFTDLPSLLKPHDLLIFNNTRVMRARLFGHKETGGQVEILIERLLDAREALAHVRASKAPKPGSRIRVTDGAWLSVLGREGDLFRLRALESDFGAQMAEHGHMPLPPYIHRPDERLDESRYQTVLARRLGAVAAPTAALHFDAAMLARLDALGVARTEITLHVGAGTFQPVREEDLERHHMHAEWLEVSETVCDQVARTRRLGGRVIAVGTTSVRSLETAAAGGTLSPFQGESRLFIRPGYRFKIVDAMITNFHLPESTLLMLVSAFSGYSSVMNAYRHAIEQRYRFFSYGDAMFLTRRDAA